MPKIIMTLLEVQINEGWGALYFQILSDPILHPEVDAGGTLRVAILEADIPNYEAGKVYDLNLNEIIPE
jgi:hypothetical protein